ncbi:MAG: hypothetical protein ABIG35_07030 [Pseudomonadota bacterium]
MENRKRAGIQRPIIEGIFSLNVYTTEPGNAASMVNRDYEVKRKNGLVLKIQRFLFFSFSGQGFQV